MVNFFKLLLQLLMKQFRVAMGFDVKIRNTFPSKLDNRMVD